MNGVWGATSGVVPPLGGLLVAAMPLSQTLSQAYACVHGVCCSELWYGVCCHTDGGRLLAAVPLGVLGSQVRACLPSQHRGVAVL